MHHAAGQLLALVLCASSIWTTAAATTCVKASAAPNGLCNVQGTYQKNVTAVLSKSTNPAKANSVQECASFCARHNPGCQTFEFIPASKACRLFSLPANKVYKRSKGEKPLRIFNDASCYSCGDICKSGQPFGAQLLDNGGFESAYLGPWKLDNATRHTTPGAGSSGHAVTLGEKPTAESVFEPPYYYYEISEDTDWAVQTFVNCPGQYYEVSFDYSYKMNISNNYDFYGASPGFSFAYLTLFDGDMVLDRSTSFSFSPTNREGVNGAWARGRVVSDQNEVNQFSVSASFSENTFFTPGNNTLSIDNVKLFRRPAPVPVPGSTSPPGFNGGFEKDKGLPWTVSTTNEGPAIEQFLVSPGLDGSNRAVRLEGEFTDFHIMNDKVRTVPNTMYILSVDILHMNDQSEYDSALFITPSLRNGDNVATYSFPRSATLNKTLTFSHPLFAQSNETSIEFFIEVNAGDNVLLVDNVSFLPLSEDF